MTRANPRALVDLSLLLLVLWVKLTLGLRLGSSLVVSIPHIRDWGRVSAGFGGPGPALGPGAPGFVGGRLSRLVPVG